VDDRLIHGQVTVGWRQHLRYEEIWVVDDQVRGDPFLQDALRMAAPSGVQVQVYTVEEAIAAWASNVKRQASNVKRQTSRVRVACERCQALLLVRSPEVALALVEGGVPLPHLNVGNLSARPGSVRAFKSISLTPEHAAALDALARRGVRITFQLTPDDPRVDWQVVRRRMDK
jgi:mannose/fructose/N-acetylgalactosamine-specific phosphotransferase system component IIB